MVGKGEKCKTAGRRNGGHSNGKMRRDSGDTGMSRALLCIQGTWNGSSIYLCDGMKHIHWTIHGLDQVMI